MQRRGRESTLVLMPFGPQLLLAVALTAPSRPTRAAARAPAVAIRVASSLEKLRPGGGLPVGHVIELAAARGECESAQVAVRSEHPLAALSASSPALSGPSRVVPALSRVENVELRAPSGPEGSAGPWPDPLIPERDPFHGEARRAFPVAVPAFRVQAIWVELCVPREAKPGQYEGVVRLRDGERELGEVPVRLEVWPFALPATNTFPVTVGLGTGAGTKALGRPDDPETARALAAALLRHRVTPHGLSYDPPWGRCTAARCDLDWTPYDAELAPILDGTLVPGVRGTFAEMREIGRAHV